MDIAIKIELKFQKGNSFGAACVKYDENGVPITLSDFLDFNFSEGHFLIL